MKKNRLLSIVCIILFIFTSVFGSFSVHATESVNGQSNKENIKFHLYEVIDEVELDATLLLKPGAFIYGFYSEDLNSVLIQYKETMLEVNVDKLKELDELVINEIPEFIN